MLTTENKIKSSKHYISNDLTFHFINIGEFNDEIESYIDENIAYIWNGKLGDNDLFVIKEELRRWFTGKDDSKKAGFVAEFFCHLYLKELEFEQHFIFKNLSETKSMKKGFDGLYQLNNEIWLYESKSSLSTSKKISHNSNIGEAFNDIKKKLNGTKKDTQGHPIDPWTNAIHHASLIQVSPDITLIKSLSKFKKRFIKGDFEDVKNFSVIPSSTIFLEDSWYKIPENELLDKLQKLIKNYSYKKMNIICINKKSFNGFIKYLNNV